jgi:hypothetical protein
MWTHTRLSDGYTRVVSMYNFYFTSVTRLDIRGYIDDPTGHLRSVGDKNSTRE